MAPRGPGLFPAVILTAVVLVLVLAHGLSTQGGTARATGGGMDAMSIDMDPSGNTATSIGPREFCARIDRNGELDADEDVVDGLTVDVTTGPEGIPADNPMIAFYFELLYAPGSADIVAEDIQFLLASAPGSELAPFHFSDALPESDGLFHSTGIDISGEPGAADSGPGVLSRITLAATASALQGVHHLVLGEASHINRQNIAAGPETLNHAVVAIGVECPDVQPTPGPPVTTTPGTPGPTTPTRSSPFTAGPTTPHGPPTTTTTPTHTPPTPMTPGPTPTPVEYRVFLENIPVDPGSDFTLRVQAVFGEPVGAYSMALYWDRSLLEYRGCTASGGTCLDANAGSGQITIAGSPSGGLRGTLDLAQVSFRASAAEGIATVWLDRIELRDTGGQFVAGPLYSNALVFIGDPPSAPALPAAFPPTGGEAGVRGGPTPLATTLVLLAFIAAAAGFGTWIRLSEPRGGRGNENR